MGCWLAPTVVKRGGAGESRLYQTSLASCLLSVLHGVCSFCSAEVVTMMRVPVRQAAGEKVMAPAHGLFRAASPPMLRLGSSDPTLLGLVPAIAWFHGQLSTEAT